MNTRPILSLPPLRGVLRGAPRYFQECTLFLEGGQASRTQTPESWVAVPAPPRRPFEGPLDALPRAPRLFHGWTMRSQTGEQAVSGGPARVRGPTACDLSVRICVLRPPQSSSRILQPAIWREKAGPGAPGQEKRGCRSLPGAKRQRVCERYHLH